MGKKNFNKKAHINESNSYLLNGFVVAYSDGSCWHKDKIGGYGFFIKHKKSRKHVAIGPIKNTTISIMELSAILGVLTSVSKTSKVIIYSDSNYAVMSINQWAVDWDLNERNNGDLFISILNEIKKFRTKPIFKWIPGHFEIPGNEIADKLASEARRRNE